MGGGAKHTVSGKESTLDLPESHHTAWLVFFLSIRKSFGEHSAAAAGNRCLKYHRGSGSDQ